MKKEKGITMIALIFIMVIVAALVFIGIKHVKTYIEDEKKTDIKTTMLLIQGKITEVGNKHEIDEENNSLIGKKIESFDEETEYNISEELKNELVLEEHDIYILSKDDLNNIDVQGIEINKDEFYIVDYTTNDVYYSLGINGNYSLLDIENKKDEENEVENNEIEENTIEENVI